MILPIIKWLFVFINLLDKKFETNYLINYDMIGTLLSIDL